MDDNLGVAASRPAVWGGGGSGEAAPGCFGQRLDTKLRQFVGSRGARVIRVPDAPELVDDRVDAVHDARGTFRIELGTDDLHAVAAVEETQLAVVALANCLGAAVVGLRGDFCGAYSGTKEIG